MILVFFLSALWWIRIRGLWKLPDGRDWLGGIWVFFWWVGPYSVNFYSNFLLMSRAVFPPHCLAWGQTMVGIMVTSFTRVYASTVAFSTPDLAAGHCQPTPLPETPGHSGKSLVGSLILSPVSWCTQDFVCAIKESVSPVLWKFCNRIPLASKVKFPWGSQSLCWILRLGNLLWVLESL